MITLVDLVSDRIRQTKSEALQPAKDRDAGRASSVLLETFVYPSFALTNSVWAAECENIVWMCLLIPDVCKTTHPPPSAPYVTTRTSAMFCKSYFCLPEGWFYLNRFMERSGVRWTECGVSPVIRTERSEQACGVQTKAGILMSCA
jgi:hypothetical protein